MDASTIHHATKTFSTSTGALYTGYEHGYFVPHSINDKKMLLADDHI